MTTRRRDASAAAAAETTKTMARCILAAILACSSLSPSSGRPPSSAHSLSLGSWSQLSSRCSLFSSSSSSSHLPTTTTATATTTNDALFGPACLTMRVSGPGKRNRDSKSSRLTEANNERIKSAGRPGTANFVDPTKVFVGNLPFDASESDLTDALAEYWNVDGDAVDERIQSVRIVRDWRSGASKGYGFLQFYDAMAATSAMEGVNGLGRGGGGRNGGGVRIGGRRIRLDQGKRKEEEGDDGGRGGGRGKKKGASKKEEEEDEVLDDEGRVIYSALEDAVAVKEGGGGMSEDEIIAFMERGGLRGAMALTEETAGFLGVRGLYVDDDDKNGTSKNGDDGDDDDDDDVERGGGGGGGEGGADIDFEGYYNENGYSDGDYGDIDIDIDEDDDGTELVYDGVFEEMYDPNEYEGLSEEEEASIARMNREKRRAAEKKRKKRKLPFRGFGKDASSDGGVSGEGGGRGRVGGA